MIKYIFVEQKSNQKTMRKQAEQLVVGRVYADLEKGESTTFFEYVGTSENGNDLMKFVGGEHTYELALGEISDWLKNEDWYELTPEEDAIYNSPSEPTFTLSDIQRVIERVEREARFISDEDSDYDRHWVKFRDKAIDIMREELKIK